MPQEWSFFISLCLGSTNIIVYDEKGREGEEEEEQPHMLSQDTLLLFLLLNANITSLFSPKSKANTQFSETLCKFEEGIYLYPSSCCPTC